jgi:hypothetical protein
VLVLEDFQLMIYRHRAFGRSCAQKQLDIGDSLGSDVGHRSLQPPDLRQCSSDTKDLSVRRVRRHRLGFQAPLGGHQDPVVFVRSQELVRRHPDLEGTVERFLVW